MFTNSIAKLAGMKAKVLAGTAVAGAALMLAAPAAQAQHVAFGVTVGTPAYVAPAPVVVFRGPGYYNGFYYRDYNAWRAHEVWEGDHRYDRRDFDRDHHFDGRHYRR
jgi:hypothetical protein